MDHHVSVNSAWGGEGRLFECWLNFVKPCGNGWARWRKILTESRLLPAAITFGVPFFVVERIKGGLVDS